MTADQAQAPLSLGAFLTLVVIVLVICAAVLLVEHRLQRPRRDTRGERVRPVRIRGRL